MPVQQLHVVKFSKSSKNTLHKAHIQHVAKMGRNILQRSKHKNSFYRMHLRPVGVCEYTSYAWHHQYTLPTHCTRALYTVHIQPKQPYTVISITKAVVRRHIGLQHLFRPPVTTTSVLTIHTVVTVCLPKVLQKKENPQ